MQRQAKGNYQQGPPGAAGGRESWTPTSGPLQHLLVRTYVAVLGAQQTTARGTRQKCVPVPRHATSRHFRTLSVNRMSKHGGPHSGCGTSRTGNPSQGDRTSHTRQRARHITCRHTGWFHPGAVSPAREPWCQESRGRGLRSTRAPRVCSPSLPFPGRGRRLCIHPGGSPRAFTPYRRTAIRATHNTPDTLLSEGKHGGWKSWN